MAHAAVECAFAGNGARANGVAIRCRAEVPLKTRRTAFEFSFRSEEEAHRAAILSRSESDRPVYLQWP
jgi:hypothetical protein